jgi:hypothetical protein
MVVLTHVVDQIHQSCLDNPRLNFMAHLWELDEEYAIADRHMIVANLLDAGDEWLRSGLIDQAAYDDIYEFMAGHGVDPDLLRIIGGSVDYKLYAVEHWGWIRLDSARNIELWSLDRTTTERLYSGLLDIEEEYLEDISHPFNIECRSTGRMYCGVQHSFMGSVRDIVAA